MPSPPEPCHRIVIDPPRPRGSVAQGMSERTFDVVVIGAGPAGEVWLHLLEGCGL